MREQVGRAGEQESARPSTPVDLALHGVQHVRFTLHFVQRHRLLAAHERLRVSARRVERVEIIQRNVAPLARRETLDQGALPVCRAPVTTTAGMTRRRSWRLRKTKRGSGLLFTV